MANPRTDHDGKSKTASAVDGEHYPDPQESPTYAEICARSHQLWLEQGQPLEAAMGNWLEAERELKAAANSRRLVQKVHERSGSVQA